MRNPQTLDPIHDPIHALPARTLQHLDWSTLTEYLASFCQTEQGALLCRDWPIFGTAEEATARSREVQEARGLMRDNSAITLSGLSPIGELLDRVVKQGVLDSDGLRKVADVLLCGAHVRRILIERKDEAPLLARRASAIRPLNDISGPIHDSFDPTGQLRDEASSELGMLRRRCKTLREEIIDHLKAMLEDPETGKLLQDKYYTLRQQRYVLPIKMEMRHMIQGIVHGRSQTEATVYIEPTAVTELGNRLMMAASDVELEEQRIFSLLSSLVREEIVSIHANVQILLDLDLISAAARLADAVEGSEVSLGRTRRLALVEARHPLMMLSNQSVVPNDFVIEPGGTLVITGPNAGGKTVALRTIGLCSLMAMAGLHPPCGSGSEMPFYQGIYTSMGDEQDMAERLSTFTAHVANLNEILKRSGQAALVLLDEVAVGTEPTQGAALARAVLEALAGSMASVVVTTHFTSLKSLAAEDTRFSNAAMGFDEERMQPTFLLQPGALGSSSALKVARNIGLPDAVIRRAEELLGGQQLRLDGLLVELEAQRRELARMREKQEEALKDAVVQNERASELRSRLAEELASLRRKAHDEAVLELRSIRDELLRLRKQVKVSSTELARGGSGKQSSAVADQVDGRLSEVSQRLQELAPASSGASGLRLSQEEELVEGLEVILAATGARVKVMEIGSKGKVVVRANAVTMSVDRTDLLMPDKKTGKGGGRSKEQERAAILSHEPSDKPRAAVSPDEISYVRDPRTTLDLRGVRVEEGLDELERFLDRMLQEGKSAVLVIHGHGTGAMRKAVRSHLAESGLVRGFRPGQRSEGGDGVTIALLDS